MVIPKKHFATLGDMTAEQFQLLTAGLYAAADRVQTRLKPDGMNIGINNGPAAGQAVAHVHWHIIPRWEADGGGSLHSIVHTKESVDVGEVGQLFT